MLTWLQSEQLKRSLEKIGSRLDKNEGASIIYVDKQGEYVLLCTCIPYAEYVAGLSEMAGQPHLNLVDERTDDEPIH